MSLGGGGGRGGQLGVLFPLLCIGKYQSVPRLLAMIVGSYVTHVLHIARISNVERILCLVEDEERWEFSSSVV